MPPKANKKKPSGVSNDLYYEEQRVTDEITTMTVRLEALKKTYIDRMEECAMKKQRQIQLQAAVKQKEKDLEERREERVDILTDYTRQHKTDEREAIAKIAALDATLNTLREEKLTLQKEADDTEALYDRKIKEKKVRYEELCQRTVEMEKEFAAMLDDIEQSMQAV